MAPLAKDPGRVRLGAFALDLRSGELHALESDAATPKVVLREQPFQILRMLIEAAGGIVTRGEIKKALWPNDTIVDFDHSINVAIGVLRRALADSAASPSYIETVARRGYRLLVAVEPMEAGDRAGEGDAGARETPAPGDMTGRKVGHYRVLEMLGGGGMGLVYKAEDLKLGRSVALKFLPEELATDPVALQRFEREARTASALNHPNICTIHDIEEYGGRPFIAMELLEGETLQQHLAASPQPIGALPLIDIAVQACAGLQAAHDLDIVHRDVKPANIFLTKQGPVKVLDFGIAKLVASADLPVSEIEGHDPPAIHRTIEPELTRAGASVGTAGYMSPEQVRKEPLDGRSDLFSLGLVLYEMATGRRAFAGHTAAGVHAAILEETPPPASEVNPAIPAALDAIIGRALQKDRARRYQTAAELRQDLERVRQAAEPPAKTRTRSWLVAAVVVPLLLASGIWLQSRGGGRAVVTLSPSDTIVIAHVTNQTSDRVFGEALYTGLRVSLEQTPYLNVLADLKVLSTLRQLGITDPGITPDRALDVCRETNSRLVVATSIADAGNRMRIELTGLDCSTGAEVVRVQHDAVSRDAVIRTLGDAAAQLRARLGEPAESLKRFNAALDVATSASPEALELLTLGYRRQLAGSSRDAIPLYERASKADPNFVLAHSALSAAYSNLNQTALAAASGQRAYALRDRLTAPARFNIESAYYRVAGDQERSCAILSEWVQTFPHDLIARNNLALCLSDLGQLDRSLGETREAVRLLPAPFSYAELISRSVLVNRFDEAKLTFDEALRLGFDSPAMRHTRALVAYLENDQVSLEQQWQWAAGKPEPMRLFLIGRAMIEARDGRFRASARTEQQAAAAAAEAGSAFTFPLTSALFRADAGLQPPPPVMSAIGPRDLFARLLAAMTLARTGHAAQANAVAGELRRDFPSHTMVQGYALPMLDAAMKLHAQDHAGAVRALQPASKYELSNWGPLPNLYAAYLRGLALLQLRDGAAAAIEFRKVLEHRGLVGRAGIGALARLQLARAQHLFGDQAAALKSYEAFMALWQDADTDTPIYREAAAEYRRQQEIVRRASS